MVKEIMAQLLRRPPPLPVLCLGMLWRTELAGCAQRDSAEPVKWSGVRERDRDAAGLCFSCSLSLPQPWFTHSVSRALRKGTRCPPRAEREERR